MISPQHIFLASICTMLAFLLLILSTIGTDTISGLSSLHTLHPDESSTLELLKIKQNQLDSVLTISTPYGKTSSIQSEIMENISLLANTTEISLFSMPKNHLYRSTEGSVHTLQIQLSGSFENQLITLKNFETNLNSVPLRSCDFRIQRKRTKKELIGRYVFQYNSSNN